MNKAALMSKVNVVGVGKGPKVVNGKRTDTMSSVILVEKKVPVESLSVEDLVPQEFEGLPTDVFEVGKIVAQSTTLKFRPAPGGVSIGHYHITAGTLGCVVRDKSTGQRLILSNNHVLADSNNGSIGDPILQPGPYDGGTLYDRIATLYKYIPINFGQVDDCSIANSTAGVSNFFARLLGSRKRLAVVQAGPNLADCALAIPDYDGDVDDSILDIGMVDGVVEPDFYMPIRKHGRTTDLTEDYIMVMGATVEVGYGGDNTAIFEDQLVTGPLSQGGDSGSLVVSGNSAVGLLFAGSDQSTILNKISNVLTLLNVEF